MLLNHQTLELPMHLPIPFLEPQHTSFCQTCIQPSLMTRLYAGCLYPVYMWYYLDVRHVVHHTKVTGDRWTSPKKYARRSQLHFTPFRTFKMSLCSHSGRREEPSYSYLVRMTAASSELLFSKFAFTSQILISVLRTASPYVPHM